MSSALERVAELVRRETGISTRPAQLPSLAAALRRVDPTIDAETLLSRWGDADLLGRLIEEVTVNETFFFRQRKELDTIDWRALLDGARAAGFESLRVWVAACSTGEEAYTLAMLASEAFAPLAAPVSILGTDISTGTLERARRGRYGRRAIRSLDPQLRQRYFEPTEGGLVVGARLRELVQFRHHNLVLEPAPTEGRPFDLIACRNVLIYFDAESVERVIESLEASLAPHGMLVLGAADRLCGSARRLAQLNQAVRPASVERRRVPDSPRALRRPLGLDPEAPAAPDPVPDGALAAALAAANAGDLERALEVTERRLHEDPLDADAYFIRGLAELGLGDERAAVQSLRRSLYVDPAFGLAAFKLGRAHERLGDERAALRAYERALRTLEPGGARHELILNQVDLGDVAAACAVRVKALREASAGAGLPSAAGGRP